MKHLLLFESFCDGCKYFDMNNIRRFYPAYENPVYSLLWKRTTEELIFINPKQYIYTVARNFGNLSYDDALMPVSDELVDKYVNAMKNGDKFPVGHYTTDRPDQEGRHRAVAMMKLGVDKMPIIKRTINIPKDYIKKEVEKIKDLSKEELNQYYINKGYLGITDLDWRELQAYIKYPERY
jgi:hypothetical protein